MKIALIDNMNNNFFTITRFFRDMGIDAILYLIPNAEAKQFLPQEDTFEDIRNVSWIKVFPCDYLTGTWPTFNNRIIKSEFKKYDYIIACGLSVGILNSANIKTDLFIPYGFDLYNQPFFKFAKSGNPLRFIRRAFYSFFEARLQTAGIRNSRYIISNTNWPISENAIKKLGVRSINLPRLMIYPESEFKEINPCWKFLKAHDFIVFSPTRHLWKTNQVPLSDFNTNGGMKRNDKLIRAFARIVNQKKFKNPCLVLFEYGCDVGASKELISSLQISQYVHWNSLIPRKILLQGMSLASLVADQFRQGMSATSAGTTNEAMAVGIAVIANTDGAIFDKNDPYYHAPVLQALEEDEILKIFDDYASNPTKYHQIGISGKKWFNENLGIGLAKKYLSLLDIK